MKFSVRSTLFTCCSLLVLVLIAQQGWGQVVIHENVELKSTGGLPGGVPRNTNSGGQSHSVTFRYSTDRPVTVRVCYSYGDQPEECIAQTGEVSVTIDAACPHYNYGVLFGIQLTQLCYLNPSTSTDHFEMYVDGTLVQSDVIYNHCCDYCEFSTYFPAIERHIFSGFTLNAAQALIHATEHNQFTLPTYVDTNCSTESGWCPETDPVTISIISGSEFGSFSLDGGEPAASVNLLANEIGGLRFNAVDTLPNADDGMVVVQASSVGIVSTDTFTVRDLRKISLRFYNTIDTLMYGDEEWLAVDARYGDGGCVQLQTGTTFTWEITEGQRWADLKANGNTDIVRDVVPWASCSGTSFRVEAFDERPDQNEPVQVRVSTNHPQIAPVTTSLIVSPPTLLLNISPGTITYGETANLVLKQRLPDGTITDLPANTYTMWDVLNGYGPGNLVSPDGEQIDIWIEGEFQTASFVASELTPQPDSVQVVIEVWTDNDWAMGKLVVKKEHLDHFLVTAVPETISHFTPLPLILQGKGERNKLISSGSGKSVLLDVPITASVINVVPVDAGNNPVLMDPNTQIVFTLDNVGSQLGSYRGPAGQSGATVIATLSEVNGGGVTYIADGQVPSDELGMATLTAVGGSPEVSGNGRVVVADDCSTAPPCDGSPALAPRVAIIGREDGFAGVHTCSEEPTALGVFKPIPRNTEPVNGDAAVDPLSVAVCFNRATNTWDFHVATIQVNAIVSICESNSGQLRFINDISQPVANGDQCCAKRDFDAFRVYHDGGIAFPRHNSYVPRDFIRAHESQHQSDYQECIERSMPKFRKDFSELQSLSCAAGGGSVAKAHDLAEQYIKSILLDVLDGADKEWNWITSFTNFEEMTNESALVDSSIRDYIHMLHTGDCNGVYCAP